MQKPKHHSSATAHQAWDQNWRTDAGRKNWLTPEPDVLRALALLKERGAQNALDLGCGVGRHALAMAQAGLTVWGFDMSSSGLQHAQKQADELGLSLRLERGEMTALPYEDGFFDYVLAWNVIYHGSRQVVQESLAEIRRVLKPGGWFQCTMISKRNSRFGLGEEIAPDVWLAKSGKNHEHGHPHLYSNAAELVAMLKGFEPLSMVDQTQSKPDSYHWVVVAERL